ncbi:type VII secretion integral membrane protein EccD [Tsukamurella sp. 8F]|uniref:type VII secretion integral membrane protein EccD n=1 Tax=unclassified Tsukamurella TaxID=2633480 RepID=UPI0023B9950D|nr:MULTISPECIES: type VII secretion integral membrane protein EccD [unclassified Tsukamurella]MDF0531754.1 type VII secretion integral membrane protein EccD [Tsukamurella sp. 8J]MDF0588044.1 type VII secretion integral membrane protein EccD [Tsukamurella sp. 8F]
MTPISATTEDSVEGTESIGLVRISILCGRAQADLSLPPHAPVDLLIPELLRIVAPRAGVALEDAWSTPWQLSRVGGQPLPGTATPSGVGISGGDVLVLSPAPEVDVPAVFDDVFDTVAGHLAPARRWDERAAAIVGLTLAGLACLAAVVLAWRIAGRPVSPAGVSVVGGPSLAAASTACGAVVMLGCAVLAARRGTGLVSAGLGLCAVLLAGGFGAVAVPMSDGDGRGAPHLLLALCAAATTALVTARLTGRGLAAHTAVVTAACLGSGAAAIVMCAPGRRIAAAAAVATVGYALLCSAPRIGAALGRLPLPHVPAAGERIDPVDADPPPTVAGLDAVALGGRSADPANTSEDSADASGRTASERVDAPRARAADAATGGVVVGAALAAACGLVTVGTAGREIPTQNLAFVLVVATVLCLRGRTHADPVQAGVTVSAGALAAGATACGLASGYGWWPVVGSAGLAGIALLALACGVFAPRRTFTPVQRRFAELGEYLLIASVAPLLCWVWDAFAFMRNL